MSILQNVSSGVSRSGIRMVIASVEKMGKTTFCANAPGCLLVPLEVGYAGVSVDKTPMLQTYMELRQFLDETTLAAQQGKFKWRTIAFDSVTALERMIHEHTLQLDPTYRPGASKTATMESAHGGYGKAYTIANALLDGLLKQLDQLAVYGGVNIIFTCHVFSSKVSDPTSGEYDSWDLLLHSPKNQKTYGKRELLTQWADIIGFLYEPIFLSTTEKGNLTRAISQNKGRVLGLSRTPAYLAGNRFGLLGEVPIPAPPANGWNVLAEALYRTVGLDVYTR